MAPRTCPFCKKTRVDHKATICPYCRSKIEPIPFWKTGRGIILIILGIFFGIPYITGKYFSKENSPEKVSIQKNQSAELKNNIGKTAFSAYTGKELGKIEDVMFANKSSGTRDFSQWYYVVNQEGRMWDCPIASVVVKDIPSTKAKYPKHITGRIDESLKEIASEFGVFLAEFNGQLNNLYIENQNMFVDWYSEKCDLKEEIMSFLTSIYLHSPKLENQRVCTVLENINSVVITRTCANNTKNFSIDSFKIKQRLFSITPQIDDKQLLQGIEE